MKTMRGSRSADYKVPGGKLLRVNLTLDDSDPPAITSLTLNGDFFMHPEDAIEDLERRLTGTQWEESALRAQVQAFFESDVQIIGADVDSIVHVILVAEGTGDEG